MTARGGKGGIGWPPLRPHAASNALVTRGIHLECQDRCVAQFEQQARVGATSDVWVKIGLSLIREVILLPFMPTAAQIRAARALLNWSQQDLAAASKIGRRTVNAAESGNLVTYDTLRAFRKAFEAKGVKFFRHRDGVSVRLIER